MVAWTIVVSGCTRIEIPSSILVWPPVATPLWGKCEDEIYTPKSENLESSRTPATSELDCRGQNTSPWSVIYIVGKGLKCRCRKWPPMSHSDIYSTSYGRKKGRESNWQFDSRPQEVGNRPDYGVCRWSATYRWKALEESYKFASNLIPIQGLSQELWAPKVLGVQTGTVSGLLLGSPGNKSHLDAGAAEQCKEYYMVVGDGFPESGPWWVKWVCVARGLSQHQGCSRRCTNPLVVGFDAGPSNKIVVPLPSLILELSARPSHPL
jgi:hypothetical protein